MRESKNNWLQSAILFKMNQNKIIYTWIFFSSCDIWVTTWCKSRGWNNISRGNENKTLLSCYVETQFINQFILFICTLSSEPLHLTASSDTECFNLTQTKGPRPKLYQNVILPHIKLVNSEVHANKNTWHSSNWARLRSDELYQWSAPKIDLDRGYANMSEAENNPVIEE